MYMMPTASVQQGDTALIDRIVYLASLASTSDVDARMDTLRTITARMQPDVPLPEQDRLTLQGLESELKQYLITKDPLRDFTAESLEQRLRARVAMGKQAASSHFGLLTAFSLLAPSLVFLMPSLSWAAKVLLYIPVFFVVISSVIVWVYITALRNFKPELRQVLLYQCAAAIAMAIALAVYIPLHLLRWSELPFFQYGGLPWGGGVCMLLLYLSLRRYAQLLGLRAWSMSFRVLFIAIASAVFVGAVVPHTEVAYEQYLRISVVGMFMLATFCAFGAATAWKLIHSLTPAYARSLRVLFAFLVMCCVFGTLFAGNLLVNGELSASKLTLAMVPSAGPPLLLLLYCAHSFKRETGR